MEEGGGHYKLSFRVVSSFLTRAPVYSCRAALARVSNTTKKWIYRQKKKIMFFFER